MIHDVVGDTGIRRLSLWFGFLGGAVAWTLHILLAAVIAEWGCVTPLAMVGILGLSWTAFLILVVSIVMLAISVVATLVAFGNAKRMKPGAGGEDDAQTMARQMARLGSWTSGLFVFIILVQSIPIFYFLRHC